MTANRRKGVLQGRGMRWRAIIAGLFLLMALAAGCSEDKTSQPVPTPTLKHTPRPTFTPVPTPTFTPTKALTPTPLPPTATPTVTPSPTRAENISPLTGLEVDPAKINRRVLAMRIGNDPEIRPQEGLGAADIVYEEIMDGWAVTRFTALFLESEAKRVRPLRSARLVSLSIVPQYDAALVHTGASDPIRYLISQASFVDLDQYFHPEPYGILPGYDWRGRMYTSTEAVRAYLAKIGKERETPIDGYVFDETPPEGQPAPAIRIPYPRSSAVDWVYDPASGRYLRYVQGVPHVDALTGQQIAADNVIIFYAEHRKTDIVEDVLGSTAIDIVMTGSGRAVICRDGVRVEAEWRREAEDKVILYWDEAGNIIPLRPGKTWIQLVPPDYKIVFE